MILTAMVSAIAYASVSDPTVSIFSFYIGQKQSINTNRYENFQYMILRCHKRINASMKVEGTDKRIRNILLTCVPDELMYK